MSIRLRVLEFPLKEGEIPEKTIFIHIFYIDRRDFRHRDFECTILCDGFRSV